MVGLVHKISCITNYWYKSYILLTVIENAVIILNIGRRKTTDYGMFNSDLE